MQQRSGTVRSLSAPTAAAALHAVEQTRLSSSTALRLLLDAYCVRQQLLLLEHDNMHHWPCSSRRALIHHLPRQCNCVALRLATIPRTQRDFQCYDTTNARTSSWLNARLRASGHRNMPIRAGFSEDGGYVVCGSDSGAVFVWDVAPTEKGGKRGREALRRDKVVACESFQVRTEGR